MRPFQKGFAAVFALFLIVLLGAGIFIGVRLSQNKQTLKSQAVFELAEDSKYGSTPISEINKLERPANGIKLWPGQIVIGPDLVDFIATHYEYVHLGLDPEVLDKLKAKNPNIKTIVPVGGAAQQVAQYDTYKYFSESDFLHPVSSPSSRIQIQGHDAVNIGSADTRQKYINALNDILSHNSNIDGFLFDGYHPWGPALSEPCVEAPNCHSQLWGTPQRESDYWYAGFRALNALAQQQIPKELFFNGVNPSWNPPLDVGLAWNGWADHFTGAYIEHTEYAYINADYFDKLLVSIQQMVSSGKKILFNGEPGLLYSVTGKIPTIDLDMQRFFLAMFLLINNNETTYYGYVPGEPYPQDISNVYFYKDWYQDYGVPASGYSKHDNGLYIRPYSNGIVIVNPTDQPVAYDLGLSNLKEWASDGQVAPRQVQIPPKSGKFYFALVNASPSSSGKIGDVNQDGKVNIFDFNILIQEFGKTGTAIRADLNRDQKVNIFDFNILVSNFGK